MKSEKEDLMANLRNTYDRAPRFKRREMAYHILLKMFRDPAMRFEDVGKHLGIDRVNACKLYHRYFEPVVQLSGLQRRRERNEELLRERVQGFDDNLLLKFVAKRAYQAGLDVRRVQQPANRWKVRQSALYIDEQLCLVHHATHSSAHGARQRYASALVVRPGIIEYCARIVRVDVANYRKGTLVIPAHVLMRMPGHSRRVHIWIPLKKNVSQLKGSQIDWWQYDNAWHLLEADGR